MKIKIKPVLVKICGITIKEDAIWAANLGADFVGINLCPESPRKVSIEKALEISSSLPSFVKTVGVFVNEELAVIEKILKKVPLHVLQLHGNESPDVVTQFKNQFHLPIWKVVHIENEESLNKIADYVGIADVILLDRFHPLLPGGTGEAFDWTIAVKAKEYGMRIILSGGLKPENVREAISQVEPYAVDTASGVEKEGHPRRKDIEKMKLFILGAKS